MNCKKCNVKETGNDCFSCQPEEDDVSYLKGIDDIVFLALTIWREARGESKEGKTGVACAVLNRVKRPSWWGNDIKSVLFKKWQFSSITDQKDSQLTTWPLNKDKSWHECMEIAHDAIHQLIENPVPGADSYHDISINPPFWADKEKFVKQIGKLMFYNLDNDIER